MNRSSVQGNFCLIKWYLDFVDDKGVAMIFYAAHLTWYGMSVKYASWLEAAPEIAVKLKQSFRNVQLPLQNDESITWQHPVFGISGTWHGREKQLQTRLVDMPEGFLDWNCFQPASEVVLNINGKVRTGKGYAEQLILTVPPWLIPMHTLRWGRFLSKENNLVWIELKEDTSKQWLWWNGEKQTHADITDDYIHIPYKNFHLALDRNVILESEKKISAVVGKLIQYLPGFKNNIPIKFLMADEHKWLSNGTLLDTNTIDHGTVIHELVNFQPETIYDTKSRKRSQSFW